MSKTVDDGIALRTGARLRIYAYSIDDEAHRGQLKIGKTWRSAKKRVAEQLKTAAIKNFRIELDESAEKEDGTGCTDEDVRDRLKRKGFSNPYGEWMQCTVEDVQTVLTELRTGKRFTGTHHKRFKPRPEQEDAVKKTLAYFRAVWTEDPRSVPRFLWNAKMRFGKTFAAYRLAKECFAKRVLVVTYKVAAEDSWQSDLETHADFQGWVFFSRALDDEPPTMTPDTPLVCFASLQDLRGRTTDASIKPHNQWIHDTEWDLVVVDEYHYGAWNASTRELLAGETGGGAAEFADAQGEDREEDSPKNLTEKLGNIRGKAFLCLSGTPFRAIASKEFAEDQIFNWTYTDEQRAKEAYSAEHPDERNPYGALPQMRLLVYELPHDIQALAVESKRDEVDLSAFFAATGRGGSASFKHQDQVQAWLVWLQGQDRKAVSRSLSAGTAKPFPYADTSVLAHLNHSVWFLPSVASVFAMKNLLANTINRPYWGRYAVTAVAGSAAGIGRAALPPVRNAIGDGRDTQTITLTCGKLLTGVTVPQWSAILMLTNLNAPESYFQAAFRVQSSWTIQNPDGDDPNEERVLKDTCLVLDFAPNRALRLFADYGMRLGKGRDADQDVLDLLKFLPILGFDGTKMEPVDLDKIVDTAFRTTTIDTRQMDSGRFIAPDVAKLNELSEKTKSALARLKKLKAKERSAGKAIVEIQETSELKDVEGRGEQRGDQSDEHTANVEEDRLSEDELAKRLKFLAMRINAFMYLSDEVEKNLSDVLSTEEGELFQAVMGVDRSDMSALVDAGLFNEQAMRLAIHQFRRADYESFGYTGLNPRLDRETENE